MGIPLRRSPEKAKERVRQQLPLFENLPDFSSTTVELHIGVSEPPCKRGMITHLRCAPDREPGGFPRASAAAHDIVNTPRQHVEDPWMRAAGNVEPHIASRRQCEALKTLPGAKITLVGERPAGHIGSIDALRGSRAQMNVPSRGSTKGSRPSAVS